MTKKTTSVNNKIWDIPFLPAIPKFISGLTIPQQLISNRIIGEWQFLFKTVDNIPSPYAENQNFDFNSIDKSLWNNVIVPCSLTMQGFGIQNNCEYYYKTTIKNENIASHDFRSFIRFHGVYSNCRIWVNNDYVTTHIGGFAPFDIELSSYKDDKDIELVVGISDVEGDSFGIWNPHNEKVSNAAWASFYAHNNIGGILRDVTLYHLPKNFVLSQKITPSLINNYRDGKLNFKLLVSSSSDENFIKASLIDLNGNLVKSQDFKIDKTNLISTDEYNNKFNIDFSKCSYKMQRHKDNDRHFSKAYVPFKKCQLSIENKLFFAETEIDYQSILPWTAELPQLYTLEITLIVDGKILSKTSEKIGFRQIEFGGQNGKDVNKIYVNGSEVKLRGVCRHDISHRYGRSLSIDDEAEEIVAFKRNNINHVRTSHYPCSQNYAKLCDEHGIYLELENAVCFKGSNGYDMNCSPNEILQNLSEIIEFYHNHPSIIIWSTANESGFDKSVAFRLSYDYVKEKDNSRPVIFSYPFTTVSKPKPYDIFSKHYKKVTNSLGKKDMPILHDEFAHVACYNIADILKDNDFRLAWGESIKIGWDNIIMSDGALGCAIWGGIDDIFYLPNGLSGSHQRHTSADAVGYGEWGAVLDVYKREKPEAYLTKKAFSPIKIASSQIENGNLILNIKNRFDHVNLNQIECKLIKSGNQIFYANLIKEDILPKSNGKITIKLTEKIENFEIAFYLGDYEVERDSLCFNAKDEFLISHSNTVCNDIKLKTSLSDGKVEICNKDKIIATAPFFYIGAKQVVPKSRKILFHNEKTIKIKERFGAFKTITYEITHTSDGIIFKTSNSLLFTAILSKKYGIGLLLNDEVVSVEWNKKCLYNCYPNDHLDRAQGKAFVRPNENNEYGIKPNFGWKDDSHNFFLSDERESQILRVTNDFLTTRTNIVNYCVNFESQKSIDISPISNDINCYTSYQYKTENIECVDQKINYSGSWNIHHKNSTKQCIVSRKKNSFLSFDFIGSSVKIYGTRSKKQGEVAIYIDGELNKILSTKSDICDVLDFAVLYNIVGLTDERHTLKIEIMDNMGVRLSGFEVFRNNQKATESMLYVSVGSDYQSLAWGNYYQNKLPKKAKKGMEFKINLCQMKK